MSYLKRSGPCDLVRRVRTKSIRLSVPTTALWSWFSTFYGTRSRQPSYEFRAAYAVALTEEKKNSATTPPLPSLPSGPFLFFCFFFSYYFFPLFRLFPVRPLFGF